MRKPPFYAADKARDFGAGPLFNQILPLLMSPTLEDQERHLLVKVGTQRVLLFCCAPWMVLPKCCSFLCYQLRMRQQNDLAV